MFYYSRILGVMEFRIQKFRHHLTFSYKWGSIKYLSVIVIDMCHNCCGPSSTKDERQGSGAAGDAGGGAGAWRRNSVAIRILGTR